MQLMKRYISLVIVIFFANAPYFACAFPEVLASETLDNQELLDDYEVITLDSGVVVEVYIEDDSYVTSDEIEEIISLHDIDTNCRITFYPVESTQTTTVGSGIDTRDIFQPFPYYTYDTERTPLGDPYAAKTDFVISVAKGQTIPLTEEYTGSLKLQIETGEPFIAAQIGASISCTYGVSKQFSGPPEDSQYNSRSYYVRYFAQRYEWVQKQYYWGMVLGVTSGTASVPTEYQAYSIDRLVS